jgi:predicted DNA-binding helix-hairpin-helix protein
VNIELPTEQSLQQLAPEKKYADIEAPMSYLNDTISGIREERKVIRSTPAFAPGGQSTQMVIGATPESDLTIMRQADRLYQDYRLRRVYYSGYVPVNNDDNRLPHLETQVPVLREHRLYQADWLMRNYGFEVNEIVNEAHPQLDTAIDPKLGWALRNLQHFPVDINTADETMIRRIPGIGLRSAERIVQARAFGRLGWEQLRKIGVAVNRARYFALCRDSADGNNTLGLSDTIIRKRILDTAQSKFVAHYTSQLSLF